MLRGIDIFYFCPRVVWRVNRGKGFIRTYFAHHFIVLKHSPGDIDAIIIPVGPRHMLVDIGIDARHVGGGSRSVCESAHNQFEYQNAAGQEKRRR